MKKLLAVVAAGVLGTQAVNADLLVAWDFAGLSGITAGSVTSNVAAVDMADTSAMLVSRGSGLTAASNTGGYSANNWTTAASIDLTDYFEFNLLADAGFTFSVTQLVFNVRRTGTSAPSTYEVRSSEDGFASSLASLVNTGTTTSNFLVNVSSAASSSLSYRFYGWNATAASGNMNLGGTGNDIAAFGTVIPEPGTVAMMGLGLLALLHHRRKR